jgi:hypothetical protein
MLMIGDGVLGILRPVEHCLIWRGGPDWWRDMIEWFAAHPEITRAAAVAELIAGVGISRRVRSQGWMRGQSVPLDPHRRYARSTP